MSTPTERMHRDWLSAAEASALLAKCLPPMQRSKMRGGNRPAWLNRLRAQVAQRENDRRLQEYLARLEAERAAIHP